MVRQELILLEVEDPRLHPLPVLHTRADRARELAPRPLPARSASQEREPVLGHPQPCWHDLYHLLPAVAYDLCRVERGVTASTLPRPVLDHTVRSLTEP